ELRQVAVEAVEVLDLGIEHLRRQIARARGDDAHAALDRVRPAHRPDVGHRVDDRRRRPGSRGAGAADAPRDDALDVGIPEPGAPRGLDDDLPEAGLAVGDVDPDRVGRAVEAVQVRVELEHPAVPAGKRVEDGSPHGESGVEHRDARLGGRHVRAVDERHAGGAGPVRWPNVGWCAQVLLRHALPSSAARAYYDSTGCCGWSVSRDVVSPLVTLGEGGTSLVQSRAIGPRLGVPELWFKLEHLNPTGSFKDRFAAAEVSRLRAAGVSLCLATSSGNTGSALATYCARAGLGCAIFLTEQTPAGQLTPKPPHRATLHRVLRVRASA